MRIEFGGASVEAEEGPLGLLIHDLKGEGSPKDMFDLIRFIEGYQGRVCFGIGVDGDKAKRWLQRIKARKIMEIWER